MVVMRILVDMDSVLGDYEGYFLSCFRKRFPDEPFVSLDDRRHYALDDDYKKYEEISPGIVAKTREIFEAPGFFANIPPIPGAPAAMKYLASMENVAVYICTATITKTPGVHYDLAEKFDWVERHLGHHWTQRVLMSKDKTMVNGHLLIDDKPRITGAVETPSWNHLIFTAAHNRHVSLVDSTAIDRLDSWENLDALKDIVEKYRSSN